MWVIEGNSTFFLGCLDNVVDRQGPSHVLGSYSCIHDSEHGAPPQWNCCTLTILMVPEMMEVVGLDIFMTAQHFISCKTKLLLNCHSVLSCNNLFAGCVRCLYLFFPGAGVGHSSYVGTVNGKVSPIVAQLFCAYQYFTKLKQVLPPLI